MSRLPGLPGSSPPSRDGGSPQKDRPTRPPAGPPDPGRPPRTSLLPPWLLWLATLGMLAWIVYSYGVTRAPARVTLTYNQFLAQVAGGNVRTVTIAGQHVTGDLRTAIAKPPPASTAPAPVSSSATPAAPVPGSPTTGTSPPSYTRFQSTLPPFDDPTLLPLLQQHDVAVQFEATGGTSLLVSLLINVVPILLFVGLLYVMYRQGQGAQQQLFGFGRSKARLQAGEHPSVTFADVAGEDEAKRELTEVVDFLKEPLKYLKLGATLPRGVLLIGPPGTGKTLLGRAVAGEAGVPFFNISGSEFVEMFVGVGASRVRDLFTQAKASAPDIVFIDEIDAVGRQRGAGLGGGNDEREQTLNQILVEMDGFDTSTNVIVIAATNRPDVLDPALVRPGRFDRQVTVGLPDKQGRQAILAVHTRGKPVAADVDLSIVARATPGFSGADLANLANEAALSAARLGRPQITMADFDAALDRIVFGTKQAVLLDEVERRSVAYHESGHALVASRTPGADPVTKITIVPHGRALGMTQQLPIDERHTYARDYLIGRLAVMLGGRAAEEIVLNEPTTGAENDLKAASDLARRMVGTWGMSAQLGPVYFGVGEEHPFLGRVIAQERTYGDTTASAIDTAVQDLIAGAHQRAIDLLRTHRDDLDAMAAALLDKETLSSAEVQALLAQTVPVASSTGE
jgi:cell division protease FtsH